MTETYELFALRYAMRDAKHADHFRNPVEGPDRPMPMDYFVWVARSPQRTLLIDTGFKPDVAAQRGRTYLRSPSDALAAFGVQPGCIEDIVITHMHYDHAGTIDAFPKARLHLQAGELGFVTSRKNEGSRRAFEVDDVNEVLRALYAGRVHLYEGSVSPWPGVSLHLLGGHTPGTQAVRVRTKRGWVVLAADASHFYENIETRNPFAGTYDVEQNLAGFDTLQELAESPQHVVPGHDPLVMQSYPDASPGLAGVVIRLDEQPGN